MAFNEVIDKLEKFTDISEWERLCCDILSQLGYRGIEPQSVGGKDGGKDAVVLNTSLGNVAVHMSLRKDWKKKLYEDLEETKGKDYQKICFCTNRKIGGITKDKLREEILKEYGVEFDIFDQERFRVEIENNRPELLRKIGLADLSLYIEYADLLSLPTKKDRASKLKIAQKYLNESLDSKDFVKINKKDGKQRLDIQAFTKPITGSMKLNINKEKLDGYTDLQKFINDKISEGENIILTEDEIEHIKIDNPYGQTPDGKPTRMTISAGAIAKGFNIDIEIINSDIYYENIKIAPISRKKEYAVVKSFDSPLIIIFKLFPPTPPNNSSKITYKFKLDSLCDDLFQGIKFNKFLKAFKENDHLIIRKSDSKEIFLSGKIDMGIEYDEYWLELLNKLYFIGQKLSINFPFPKSLDYNEMRLISSAHEALQTKKLTYNFLQQEIELNSKEIDKTLKYYEEKGYFDNVEIRIGSLKSTLLGKEINLGQGVAHLPLLKFVEDVNHIKAEIEKSGKVKCKIDTVGENNLIEVNLIDLENK